MQLQCSPDCAVDLSVDTTTFADDQQGASFVEPPHTSSRTCPLRHLKTCESSVYSTMHVPKYRVLTGRYSDDRLEGRKEKRLPLMVAVNLARPENAESHERTCTDNISAHGARVRSTYPWQLDEQAEITPASGETAVHAKVVYCQRLDHDRFFVR